LTNFSLDQNQADDALASTGPDQMRDLRQQASRREITERRRTIQRLRQALANGGFVLHYHPQVNLKSGLIHKAEAVIRLQHRRRGLILPSHFMPVAERSDVMHDIGSWALQEACMEAAGWPEKFSVAIALFPRQLQSTRLIKNLVEVLSRSGLPPFRLELELTETMLVGEQDDTMFTLKALHGLGVSMAIANFGVGYASLSALKRLPLATLKLDRSLTRDMDQDNETAVILRAAVEAGHALGCAVLADGIETAEQTQALKNIGCDDGQGPYFGPPLPAEEFRERLSRG
jgi:EAL domain-containing protein (putative c-di-GMP-specific phosphodiesterase class I)